MVGKSLIRSDLKIFFLLVMLLFSSMLSSDTDLVPEVNIQQKQNTFDILITVPKSYYLNDDSLDLSVLGSNASLDSIFYQDSQSYDERDVFFDSVRIKAVVNGDDGSAFKIALDYQLCSKKHECLEPFYYEQSFKVKAHLTGENGVDANQSSALKKSVTEQDGIADMLREGDLIIILLTFFGFGVLLAFTPCMLPVIPILSAVILCRQKDMSARRGLLLSSAYVISMSLVYALAGVLAASIGSSIQAFFQQTWIIILFSLFFFVLSLGMFGTFNIEMPKKIQSMLSARSKSSEHRTYLGVVVLGAISALIVGPCVAPPLAGALIYISQTGDQLIGALSLFVMSFGMGLPLILLGAGAGRFIPRPGPWMESVKLIFGFVMLGFSVWVLSRIIEPSVVIFLWGILLVAASVFMNLFEERNQLESKIEYMIKKLFGLLSLIFGIILIIGAIGGATNIKSPLEPYIYKPSYQTPLNGVVFKKIKADEMSKVLEDSPGPVMFFFSADWCDNCKALQKDIFTQNDVAAELYVFDKYLIDVTANTDDERALLKRYSLFGPPGIIFFDKEKNEFSSERLVGYKEKALFLEHIARVKKNL